MEVELTCQLGYHPWCQINIIQTFTVKKLDEEGKNLIQKAYAKCQNCEAKILVSRTKYGSEKPSFYEICLEDEEKMIDSMPPKNSICQQRNSFSPQHLSTTPPPKNFLRRFWNNFNNVDKKCNYYNTSDILISLILYFLIQS